MLEPTAFAHPSGRTVYGILSEPRLGIADALAGLQPTMRLVTTDDVAPGDVLVAGDGSRYRVLRIVPSPVGLVCEVAKEA